MVKKAMGEKIDLHMHTLYSDGEYSVKDVLKRCQDQKLDVISIADHDDVRAYFDLEDKKIRDTFSGVIIPATELSFNLDGHLYDVLGYDIDYKKMYDLLNNRRNDEQKKEMQAVLLEEWKEVCRKKEIKFDESIKTKNGTKSEAFNVLYEDISNFDKYPENAKYDCISASNIAKFYKVHFSNPESDFFVNEARFSPTLKEAIDMIHECGGKAFLAHSFAYKLGKEKTIDFINYAIDCGVDGLERYYSTFTDEEGEIVENIAKSYLLYISGGTDFHGEHVKPGIEVGKGMGNMSIPKTIILDWAEKYLK